MPAPRQAPVMQQAAVAVATPPATGFAPYAVSEYSRRLPYPPLTGTPVRSRRSLPTLRITVAVLLAAILVTVAVFKVQDDNATRNAVNHTSIQFPADVAGLNKITGAEAVKLTSIATEESGNCSCGALYQTAGYTLADGSPRAIVVIAKLPVGSDLNAALAAEERGFDNSAGGGGSATVFSDVEAGSLGGRMQRGNRMIATVPATVCMFADRGAAGSVLLYDHDDGAAAQDLALVQQLRAAIEIRT